MDKSLVGKLTTLQGAQTKQVAAHVSTKDINDAKHYMVYQQLIVSLTIN